jgi:hypothetical protein
MGSGPMRHHDMYQTDALRDVGTTHLLAAAREVGARKMVVESALEYERNEKQR